MNLEFIPKTFHSTCRECEGQTLASWSHFFFVFSKNRSSSEVNDDDFFLQAKRNGCKPLSNFHLSLSVFALLFVVSQYYYYFSPYCCLCSPITFF